MFNPGSGMPPVTKNLLIINALAFVITMLYGSTPHGAYQLNFIAGLYYFGSPHFQPFQVVTHMFLHGNLMHIFFNMFALWIFGSALEQIWGPKRFLLYYFITGLGAAFLHQAVHAVEIYSLTGQLFFSEGQRFPVDVVERVSRILLVPAVGASGAVFGLLLGFGMFFPNTKLMLLFLPVPIKAKYFVIFYGLITLFMGVQRYEWDNIAHFAHLGGMLFGFIMIKIWQLNQNRFF